MYSCQMDVVRNMKMQQAQNVNLFLGLLAFGFRMMPEAAQFSYRYYLHAIEIVIQVRQLSNFSIYFSQPWFTLTVAQVPQTNITMRTFSSSLSPTKRKATATQLTDALNNNYDRNDSKCKFQES